MTDQQQRTEWARERFASFVEKWISPAARELAAIADDAYAVLRAIKAIAPKDEAERHVGWAVFKREIDATYNHRDHPSGYIHTMISAVFDSIPTNAYESQRKKHPDQEFIICEIREIP
jgi:hypothetical protein